MSIRQVMHEYEKMEIRGVIPPGSAAKATLATILEAGATAFHRAYFGDKIWGQAITDARTARHEGNEIMLGLAESIAQDVGNVSRAYRETQTTTDFPVTLAQARDLVRRAPNSGSIESALFAGVTRRTAVDFKPMRAITPGNFGRLKLRPEGTNVEYARSGTTEDGYRVSNYELAVPLTWEAFVNDDIGEWTGQLAALGIAAARERILVMFEAIRDQVARVTPSGTFETGTAAAGGPTAPNLEWLYAQFATAANDEGQAAPRVLSEIAIPPRHTLIAKRSLGSEKLITGTGQLAADANPVQGLALALVEPLMAEVFGQGAAPNKASDWLGIAGGMPWLEFAALRGFESGPKTYTKMPDVHEHIEEGSFDNHSLAVKVGDTIGAKVTDDNAVKRVAGE